MQIFDIMKFSYYHDVRLYIGSSINSVPFRREGKAQKAGLLDVQLKKVIPNFAEKKRNKINGLIFFASHRHLCTTPISILKVIMNSTRCSSNSLKKCCFIHTNNCSPLKALSANLAFCLTFWNFKNMHVVLLLTKNILLLMRGKCKHLLYVCMALHNIDFFGKLLLGLLTIFLQGFHCCEKEFGHSRTATFGGS